MSTPTHTTHTYSHIQHTQTRHPNTFHTASLLTIRGSVKLRKGFGLIKDLKTINVLELIVNRKGKDSRSFPFQSWHHRSCISYIHCVSIGCSWTTHLHMERCLLHYSTLMYVTGMKKHSKQAKSRPQPNGATKVTINLNQILWQRVDKPEYYGIRFIARVFYWIGPNCTGRFLFLLSKCRSRA